MPTTRLLFISLALSLPALAQQKPDRSLLFIGNSMIGRSMHHVKMIAQAEGKDWKITPVTKGGARLEKFKGDKEHDALGTIAKGGFTDVVFVQGTSYWFEGPPTDSLRKGMSPADRLATAEKTLAAAQEMHEHIAATGARTVLYLGYPHMPAAERTAELFAPLEAIHWVMKDRLDALTVKGKTHPTLLVPNGVLWMRGAEKWGEAVWYKDLRHGSDLAYYANAVMFYTFMEGIDPRKLKYDGELPPEQTKWIKEQAWELSQNYKRPTEDVLK
ncbi:MAG: hypothetical protein NTV80_01000 [Verrucomicrobia bacterium]|nr:hypothetical protein [Verrucomicrobiota bacterium]